jgi:Spx/MgsR family transcriptional regulator
VLSRRRVAFTTRDLIKQPLTADEIRALAALHPDGVRGLLSTRSTQLKALGLDGKPVSDAELIRAMATEPRLLRRPLVVDGKRLVVGFDREGLESIGR